MGGLFIWFFVSFLLLRFRCKLNCFFQVPETKGITLEEMEEGEMIMDFDIFTADSERPVFGSTTGIALEDQARLDDIHKRLGLYDDTPRDVKNDPEAKTPSERASESENTN